MSLESIALIGILTLLTIFLGSDLCLLLIGGSALKSTYLEIFNSQVYWVATWRLGFVLFLLFLGAVVINLAPTTRTENYLLKVGLGSLFIYLVLFFVSLVPTIGDFLTERLRADITKSANASVQSNMSLWYKIWMLLLWPRAVTVLVSFWSFLHYAMNPKI